MQIEWLLPLSKGVYHYQLQSFVAVFWSLERLEIENADCVPQCLGFATRISIYLEGAQSATIPEELSERDQEKGSKARVDASRTGSSLPCFVGLHGNGW